MINAIVPLNSKVRRNRQLFHSDIRKKSSIIPEPKFPVRQFYQGIDDNQVEK